MYGGQFFQANIQGNPRRLRKLLAVKDRLHIHDSREEMSIKKMEDEAEHVNCIFKCMKPSQKTFSFKSLPCVMGNGGTREVEINNVEKGKCSKKDTRNKAMKECEDKDKQCTDKPKLEHEIPVVVSDKSADSVGGGGGGKERGSMRGSPVSKVYPEG